MVKKGYDHTQTVQDIRSPAALLMSLRKVQQRSGIKVEGNEGGETSEGSLSNFILPIERWEICPKKAIE